MDDIKIRLSKFCYQSESYRSEYTMKHGNLLATVEDNENRYHLYEVDGFLVELSLDQFSHKLISVNPVNKTKRLSKFLRDIELVKFL